MVDLGPPIAIPADWLDPTDENGLAVGVISTSTNATPFDALWSYLDVTFVDATPPETVLYRVNAGGPEVASADGSLPAWGEDAPTASPYRVANGAGANVYAASAGSAHPGPIVMTDPSLPPSVPIAVFETERFDVAAAPEMQWQFPVDPGAEVEVRLYFAELFSGVDLVGERLVDVSVEGTVPAAFDDIDAIATAGPKGAFMRSATVVVNDGLLDLEFIHVVENPAIKGIEIIEITPGSNVPPTVDGFTPEGPVVVPVGDPLPTITVEASDANGDVITLTTDGTEPAGVTFTDLGGGVGEFTGTPTDIAATYTVTVTAEDPSAATGTGTVDIVLTDNAPPVFDTAPADAVIAETDPYTLTVDASDPDTDPITYGLVGDVPAGMVIDATTGQVDWTPGYADSGRYEITISIDDGTNPAVTDSFTLDVTQTAPPGSALYRVNAGGPAVAAADATFPDWGEDTNANPSPYPGDEQRQHQRRPARRPVASVRAGHGARRRVHDRAVGFDDVVLLPGRCRHRGRGAHPAERDLCAGSRSWRAPVRRVDRRTDVGQRRRAVRSRWAGIRILGRLRRHLGRRRRHLVRHGRRQPGDQGHRDPRRRGVPSVSILGGLDGSHDPVGLPDRGVGVQRVPRSGRPCTLRTRRRAGHRSAERSHDQHRWNPQHDLPSRHVDHR